MNFNFGEVLTRAWEILKKHKVLWIFGILAGFARGGSGGGSGGGGGSGSGGGTGYSPDNPFQNGQFDQFAQWISGHIWVVVVAGIVLFLIGIALYVLGIIAKVALIKGTHKADGGAESMNFGELWSESTPFFWRVFGLSFLIGLVFLVIMLPLILIGFVTAGVGFICLLPIICLMVPVAWVVNVVVEQADVAIALENLSMFDGFKRGLEVFKANWGALLVMSLILGIGGGIVGLIFAVPLFIAFIPLFFGISDNSTTLMIVSGVCCAVYLPVLFFLNGLLTAYVQAVWTLTYMRLIPKPQDDAPVFATPHQSAPGTSGVEGNAQ
jgi:hypothetical protein